VGIGARMPGPVRLGCRLGNILTGHAGMAGSDRFTFAYSPVVNL
jgi:hypothetical protein